MGLFSRKAAPSGAALTVRADSRGVRRARSRLADLRQAEAWYRAQPANARRRRKLEQLARAIRHYEAALDEIRGALTGDPGSLSGAGPGSPGSIPGAGSAGAGG